MVTPVVIATDVEDASNITYAISGGVDADLFNIDAATGALTFKAAPDFEGVDPKHGDTHSNEYSLTVSATDTQEG